MTHSSLSTKKTTTKTTKMMRRKKKNGQIFKHLMGLLFDSRRSIDRFQTLSFKYIYKLFSVVISFFLSNPCIYDQFLSSLFTSPLFSLVRSFVRLPSYLSIRYITLMIWSLGYHTNHHHNRSLFLVFMIIIVDRFVVFSRWYQLAYTHSSLFLSLGCSLRPTYR